jgi:hypothetical protein
MELLNEFSDIKQVVVVGPNTVRDSKNVAEIDAALASAAKKAGAQYVSTLGWAVEFGPDGGHLSERGHEQYAALLGAEIQSAASH